MANDEQTFTECLKFFMKHRKFYYPLQEIEIPNANKYQILSVLSNVPSLFKITHSSDQPLIEISIKIKPCSKYNSFIHCDVIKCNFLHVCAAKFNQRGCHDQKCKKDHSLNNQRNIRLLREMNLKGDLNVLMRFIQAFYSNQDDMASSLDNEGASNNDQKLEIKIQIPDNFIQTGNSHLLKDIFSSYSKSGGGPIRKFKYISTMSKAYLTFEDDSVAERLIKSRDVNYLSYHFVVTKAENNNDNACSNGNLEPIISLEEMTKQLFLNSKKDHFYFKNVFGKSKADVMRYAALLTATSPLSANLIDNETGTWMVNFKINQDMDKVMQSFQNFKKVLPSDIKIDTLFINPRENKSEIISKPKSKNETKIDNTLNKYVLEKRMDSNIFLQLVLKERNIIWKNELKEKLDKIKCSFTYDLKAFTVTADQLPSKDVNSWTKEVNETIKEFFRDYDTKACNYNDSNLKDILELKKNIEQTRTLYLIDYFDDPQQLKLSLLAKKNHMKDFMNKFSQYEEFFTNETKQPDKRNPRRGHSRNTKLENKIEPLDFNSLNIFAKQTSITKTVRIPLITYSTNPTLFDLAFKNLQNKFELEDYYLATDGNLKLTGSNQNVDKTINVVNKLGKNIRTKRIEDTNVKFFIFKNLREMTQDLMNEKNFLSKVEVKLADSGESPGFYITYFYDIPELDSSNDSAFDQASEFIKKNIVLVEIEITKYSHLMIGDKWKKFKEENLSNHTRNFSYQTSSSLNNKYLLLICGKKDFVEMARFKIEDFLANNETKIKEIPVTSQDANFLKMTAKDQLNKLEKKFDINIEIKIQIKDDNDISSIVVKNYPDDLFPTIERDIRNLVNSKKMNIFSIDYLPGLDTLLNNKNNAFNHAIEKIQNDTSTIITTNVQKIQNAKSSKQTPSVSPSNSNHTLNQKNSVFKTQTSNRISRILKIGNSEINLEIGSITDTKADVIVNTTSKSLNLSSGILGKSILQAAGDTISYECKNNYPNGIENNSIAITSAGNMRGISYIFHAALSHYSDKSKAANELETIIYLCMTSFIEKNLNQISFPALGTGGFGYPANLVASTTLRTIVDFLRTCKNKSYKVNIVVYDKDADVIQNFENAFDSFDSDSTENKFAEPKVLKGVNKLIKLCKTKAKAQFTIYYKADFDFKKACDEINKLINVEGIIKECFNEKNMEHLTSLTEEHIHQLSNKYSNIEITFENQMLTFYGLKNEVLSAKLELIQIISKMVSSNYSRIVQQFAISKNIQWQFQVDNAWKDFSVFLNSMIESGYSNRESKITFNNEDNEDGTIFFNVNPMVYIIGRKKINVRRLDTTKLSEDSIKLPIHWNVSNSNTDVEMFDLTSNSSEFQLVIHDYTVQDFKIKFQNPAVQIHKVQRVQNQHLYRQYSIHRGKFLKENRNPNEMDLFHGSTEESLMKICRFGFNRSYCGKNGVAYGHGVYFARNSSYSRGYTSQNSQGLFCMIRAKVIAGASCHGNSTMRIPPDQPGLNIPYDSTTDPGQSIFVCYHDNQCYPEYLIYFR